jgi:glyoxylate reductase
MAKPVIVLTQPLDPAAMTALRRLGRIRVLVKDRPPTPARLRRGCANAEIVVGLLCDVFNAAFFKAAPRLKLLALDSAGFNHVDLAAARAAGVTVTHTPGALTDATADLTWALLLACARRLPEGERLLRGGRFHGWSHGLLTGLQLRGRTLGIIGMGRIGRAVAARAQGFGLRVAYASRRPLPAALEKKLRARRLPLASLLSRSDIVSLHCPLTAATENLLNEKILARMKAGAILINTARGPVVDEAALARALREGRLAAAGLDVFRGEPALSKALRNAPNCLVLPHVGSATVETRAAMGRTVIANVRAHLAGRRPPDAL